MMATPDETRTEPPPSARRSRSRARKGEGLLLRDEILDAAERLLLRTGSAEAVSIRDVADAVGVTPPSIYRHFQDKDSLIAEVSARHFATFDAQLAAAVVGIDDPVEAVVARGRAYIRFGLANPEPYRILFMTRPESIPQELQEQWFQQSGQFLDLVEACQACIDADRLRPEYTDALQVALGLWARVHGLTSLAVSKPFLPLSDEDFIDSYVDACLRGIVADETPS
jgi:AcrR family transcriptional regulator